MNQVHAFLWAAWSCSNGSTTKTEFTVGITYVLLVFSVFALFVTTVPAQFWFGVFCVSDPVCVYVFRRFHLSSCWHLLCRQVLYTATLFQNEIWGSLSSPLFFFIFSCSLSLSYFSLSHTEPSPGPHKPPVPHQEKDKEKDREIKPVIPTGDFIASLHEAFKNRRNRIAATGLLPTATPPTAPEPEAWVLFCTVCSICTVLCVCFL